jgi:transitional endoplasmic reticulum ATPase
MKPAKKVTFAPAQKNVQLSGPGEALKRTMQHRPATTGDVVSTSVYRQPTGSDQGMFSDDFLNMFFNQQAYGLHEMRLVVTSTTPRGVVRIGRETEIDILPHYAEPEEPRGIDVTYDDIGGVGNIV